MRQNRGPGKPWGTEIVCHQSSTDPLSLASRALTKTRADGCRRRTMSGNDVGASDLKFLMRFGSQVAGGGERRMSDEDDDDEAKPEPGGTNE